MRALHRSDDYRAGRLAWQTRNRVGPAHTWSSLRRAYSGSTLLQRFAVTGALVFLVIGVVSAAYLHASVQSAALGDARTEAYDTLHARLLRHLSPADLSRPMSGNRYRRFSAFIDQSILSARTVRVKVWNQWGRVIYSNDRRILGLTFPAKDELAAALDGHISSEVSDLTAAENRDDRTYGRLLEVYIPVRFPGSKNVVGAFEVYQTYAPVARQIDVLQHRLDGVLGGGLALLYLTLFGIVRRGSNTIIRQDQQLRRYTLELEESYNQTIASLAAAVDARDSSTEQHSQRVTELAVALGRFLGLDPARLGDLERGALLHDVGKIGISDTILLKPGQLNEQEWHEMRKHPEIGYRMLHSITFLQGALGVVRHHHERWDGTGYPDGLRGRNIPLEARLFAVVDAYDALTSDRPYRRRVSHDEAMVRLRQDSGTHFDPAIVSAFEQTMGLATVSPSTSTAQAVRAAPA